MPAVLWSGSSAAKTPPWKGLGIQSHRQPVTRGPLPRPSSKVGPAAWRQAATRAPPVVHNLVAHTTGKPGRAQAARPGAPPVLHTTGQKRPAAPSWRTSSGSSTSRGSPAAPSWKTQPWKRQRSQEEAAVLDGDPAERATMVFVGNLPYSLRWTDLQDHMKQAGSVAFVRLLTKEGLTWGSSPLGTACVRYDTAEDAQQAISLHGSTLKSREIQVDVWSGKIEAGRPDDAKFVPEGDPACIVFVGNLSYATKAGEVWDHMEGAGTVEFCQVLTDNGMRSGQSKGCACVRYASIQDANKALETLNESTIGNRAISVDPWEFPGEAVSSSKSKKGTTQS